MIRPSGPPTFFADTSFFYALADRDERRHPACAELLGQIVSSPAQILTTNLVVAETHALLLSRLGRNVALDWLSGITHAVAVIRVTELDETAAMEILSRYDDKDFSFADAASFAVMKRLGVSTALSLDFHFVQYGGFRVLPLEGDRIPAF